MNLVNSLYLHFPFCKHLCNYCDFYKTIPQNFGQDIDTFHQLFTTQFSQHEKLMREYNLEFSPLKTLYIGGGTPSLWGEKGAHFLRDFLAQNNLSFQPDYEFTMEVNPATWTEASIEAWRKTGVNRFSIGVQALREDFIKILDRVHDLEEVYKTLRFFRDLRMNFSLDLMLGLPKSSELKRDVIQELQEMLEYNPSHFSVYILTVKEQYKHFSDLPDEDYIEEEYLKVSTFLKQQGFGHYEVSNYALPGKESHHNLQYWKGASVAALGPSATGYFRLKDKALRYKWKTSQPLFETELLGIDEMKLEKIYLALRTNLGLSLRDLSDYNQVRCESWAGRGLATVDNEIFRLNAKGYLLLDSLILELKIT